jgi:predicted dinucleotide-binding enzyme
MKIGVLGSGDVGCALAGGFLRHGHEVMLGTRDPKKREVRDWMNRTAGAQVGTFQDAARFGEFVVLAVLGRIVGSVIDLAKPENLAGKTVIDTTNPLDGYSVERRTELPSLVLANATHGNCLVSHIGTTPGTRITPEILLRRPKY